jgi:hypothetical protein
MLLIISDVQCGCLLTGLGPKESQYLYNFLKNMNMKILVKSVPAYLVIISDPSLWLTAARQCENKCHFSGILDLSEN